MIEFRHTEDKVYAIVLTSSLNPGGACITDGGGSSELDRDRGTVVVSSLMSYLELISHNAIDQDESAVRTLSRLWGRLD